MKPAHRCAFVQKRDGEVSRRIVCDAVPGEAEALAAAKRACDDCGLLLPEHDPDCPRGRN